MTASHQDLLDADEFALLVEEFREKKTLDWENYGKRMMLFQTCLYKKPGCQIHFDQVGGFLSDLSPDIVRDVVECIDKRKELRHLVQLKGVWGLEARKQKRKIEEDKLYGVTVFDRYRNRLTKQSWEKFLEKAPKLYGILRLTDLCSWIGTGQQLFLALQPKFADLTIRYHYNPERPVEMLQPFQAFLLKQLKSPYLRRLEVFLSQGLDLEDELFEFCMTDRFQFLLWFPNFSADFYNRIYASFQKKRLTCDLKRKEVQTLTQGDSENFAQMLKLGERNHHCRRKIITDENRLEVYIR